MARGPIVPIVQPSANAPAPDLSGLTPDVLALYQQLLAGISVEPEPVPKFSASAMDFGADYGSSSS